MLPWLIVHQWKSSLRSVTAYQSLAAKIVVGLFVALVALNVLGVFAGNLLEEKFPKEDPVSFINGLLFYFLVFGLLLRLALQNLPAQALRPYQIIPVSRSLLIHWTLGKTVLHLFNLIPLLFFVPVSITIVRPHSSAVGACLWLATIFLLILNSNFLALYLRYHLVFRLWPAFLTAVFLAALILSDVYGFFTLSAYSASLFNLVAENVLTPVVLLGTLAGLYGACASYLRQRRYLDELSVGQGRLSSSRFGFLGGLGDWGDYLSLELRLLLRNRRPKSSFLIVLILPLFGAMYYATTYSVEFYPRPAASLTDTAGAPEDGEVPVTFRVQAGELPEGAWVYLAGNHNKLGEWRPNGLPLVRKEDSHWERTVFFPRGTSLEYKLTLGSWPTQRLLPNGEIPRTFQLTVQEESVVELTAEGWRSPGEDVFVQIFGVYVSLLLTSTAMLVYGQFMLGWESSWFPGLVSRRLDLPAYFRAKYSLLIVLGVAGFFVSLPFAFFAKEILYQTTAAALYNIGTNSILLLFLASLSRKRLDLNASIFSMQGKSAVNYLVILPTLIFPALIYIPFALTGHPVLGLVTLSGIGLLGLLLQPLLLRAVVGQFRLHRYLILEGFRQG